MPAAASALRQRLGRPFAEDLSIPPGKPAEMEETAVHGDMGHCHPWRRLAEDAASIIQPAADERLRRRAPSEAAKGILHGAYADPSATMLAINGRFESFDRSTRNLWAQASAARFRAVETLIKSSHTTIGGILCALTVKMEAWATVFAHKKVGGPAKRAEFIMTSIRQGIEKIREIEDAVPSADIASPVANEAA